MPFMKGPGPIRRTMKYLQSGTLKLKDRVKIFTLHYNMRGEHHEGARAFAFWTIPQLQHKNQGVQINTIKNLTPSPYIHIICDNEEDIFIDVDGKNRIEIANHLKKVICEPISFLGLSEGTEEKILPNPKGMEEEFKWGTTVRPNLAHFGWGCKRQCMCEVFGQVPCPEVVALPKVMRGKYISNPELLEEEDE